MTAWILSLEDRELEFVQTPLAFEATRVSDVFSHKNNKTLAETLAHDRYRALAREIESKYARSLGEKLGDFLLQLKRAGDRSYKLFLNPHGDSTYCGFVLGDSIISKKKGLYCFVSGARTVYVGRCRDSFGRRINQGYGRIHPKNCFRDGQSTNCHLTHLSRRRTRTSRSTCTR